MFQAHYAALLVGYGVAFAGWLLAARLFPRLWPVQEEATFDHRWARGRCTVVLLADCQRSTYWSHATCYLQVRLSWPRPERVA